MEGGGVSCFLRLPPFPAASPVGRPAGLSESRHISQKRATSRLVKATRRALGGHFLRVAGGVVL